ncbi:MAG: TIGR04540 family protein [Clostridium sp.]|uniref:TIGR04540 family protein n=1 Tax=Clostridium sp. TaxID=1506 RepID=UPI0025C32C79|nr:TIGR04540 family protein [Clostridium sp.]MCE5221010.1 TIGR04540 family protein [Clostridium sp.]
MRAVYRNPKELATCLKDIVDTYTDDLISYEKMENRIMKIVDANKESIYKEKSMSVKIANVLGDKRVEIINNVVESKIKP